MAIQVFRGNGDIVGTPVVEPLLSEEVLIHRGTYEMDSNAHMKTRVTASTVYRNDLKLGSIVSLPDPSNSTGYRGKVTGISITLQNGKAEQQVDIERVVL